MCGEALPPPEAALPPDVRRGYAAVCYGSAAAVCYGSAPGCEARLCLAGSLGEKEKELSPRYGLWPKMIGLSPYQGHSPLGKLEVSGEA
jgi:hypothetical protein